MLWILSFFLLTSSSDLKNTINPDNSNLKINAYNNFLNLITTNINEQKFDDEKKKLFNELKETCKSLDNTYGNIFKQYTNWNSNFQMCKQFDSSKPGHIKLENSEAMKIITAVASNGLTSNCRQFLSYEENLKKLLNDEKVTVFLTKPKEDIEKLLEAKKEIIEKYKEKLYEISKFENVIDCPNN